MPEAFDRCRAAGGKIRTKVLSGDRYVRICIDRNGKTHAGYVKHKQSLGKPKSRLGNPGK